MSNRSKIDPAEKIKAIESILHGEWRITDATRRLSVHKKTVQEWMDIYVSLGPTALANHGQIRLYSKELRLSAVIEYLSGQGSISAICRKYGIRAHKLLRDWIKSYSTHGEIKSRKSGGGSCMRKARQTTPEERLAIVRDCLANDKNYGAIASKYNCSYQQVRNWVFRYEKMGTAGLEDRRGRRAGTQPARTSEEELRDKIAELERKNKDLQMENDLLKKVRELEMKDRCL